MLKQTRPMRQFARSALRIFPGRVLFAVLDKISVTETPVIAQSAVDTRRAAGVVINTRVRVRSQLSGIVAVAIVAAIGIFGYGLWVQPGKAVAAAANTINFQARLESSTGAIAPDGNYNVQFKLYSTLSGGTELWTESYLVGSSSALTTINGYLSTNLGSVTPFPDTINWGQQLYMTMNIGGTDSSPTWDGEMSPRLSLTSVPSAFALNSYNSSNGFTGSLKVAQLTGGDQTFTVPDQGAAGDYTLLTTNAANTGFVQNQYSSAQDTTRFWISGFARADTGFIGSSIDRHNGGMLSIGNLNATGISIGANDSNHNIYIGNGAGIQTITMGSTDTTSSLTLQSGSGNITLNNSGTTVAEVTSGGLSVQGSLTAKTSNALYDQIVIQAASVGFLSNTGTLTNENLTTAQTWTLPDETGTFCMQGSSSCGFAANSGSANYIQNQNASPQSTTNFWISGSGVADTSLLAPVLDSASAGSLGIGTSTATSVSIAKSGVTTTVNGSLTVAQATTFNGPVTIAASETLTMTGGNTAGRPASPTEGMFYFDTDTKSLLIYSNGKWQADRETTTKIVAASNSSQAVRDSADYVASGSADQSTINSALTAAAGGKVYLAEGTYNTNNSISVPNNTTLEGSGFGTLIKFSSVSGLTRYMITNTDSSGTGGGVTIRNIQLDGNDAINTSGTQHGIYSNNLGNNSGIEGITISNMYISNFHDSGVYLLTTQYSLISEIASYNNDVGIFVNGTRNTIINNSLHDNSTSGVTLNGSLYNVVTSNKVHNNSTYGVRLMGNSSDNTINNNAFRANGGGSNNNAIHLAASDDNNISGNAINDVSCSSTCYGVNVSDAGSEGNYIANNTLSGSGSITIYSANTTTQYGGQATSSGYQIQPNAAININSGTNSTNVSSSNSTAAMVITQTNNSGAGVNINIGSSGTVLANFLVNGSNKGSISVSGETVSYNAFTGSHYAKVDGGSLQLGQLASLTGNNDYPSGAGGEPVYGIVKSATANDPNILGGFVSLLNVNQAYDASENPYLVNAAGNGSVWIADNGSGNVTIGDPLISSGDVAGHAMRDPGTFAVSHVFGKAAANVDWSTVTTTVNGVKVAKVSLLYSFYDQDNLTGAANLQAVSVAGSALFGGNASFGADLSVSGHTSLTTLTVTGAATFQGDLTVVGKLRTGDIEVGGHIISVGLTPGVIVGQALGQASINLVNSAPQVVVEGTDTTGTVTVTAGAEQLGSGVLAEISFATPFGAGQTYKAVLSPTNDQATNLRVYVIKTATGFNIVSRDAPVAGIQYQFDYIVMGAQLAQIQY